MSTVRQAAAWTYRVSITLLRRPSPIGATFGLAALTFVGAALGGPAEDAPVAGAFHAVNAVLVLGLALFLTVRAWRDNLLIPPAQLWRTAPAPMPAASLPVPTPALKERVQ